MSTSKRERWNDYAVGDVSDGKFSKGIFLSQSLLRGDRHKSLQITADRMPIVYGRGQDGRKAAMNGPPIGISGDQIQILVELHSHVQNPERPLSRG